VGEDKDNIKLTKEWLICSAVDIKGSFKAIL